MLATHYEKMILFENQKSSIVTDSATQGLYLLFKNLNDYSTIILHPNTCLQVYMAALQANKIIRFVDIELETCNFKKIDLENAIIDTIEKTSRPPLVLIVHLFGISCSLEIINLCQKYKSIIIEDCAQSLFSYYSDKSPVGSKADYSVFSFGETKHLNLGNTGIITFNQKSLFSKFSDSLNQLRYDRKEKNNLFSKYRKEYYQFLENKINHKVYPNRIEEFNAFIKYYSKFFSLGAKNSKYTLEEIKKQILNFNKRIDHIKESEIYIKEALNGLKISFFKKESNYIFWRYSFLLNKKERDPLINHIRNKIPHISTWYPSIPKICQLNNYQNFSGSIELSERICNIDNLQMDHAKMKKILILIKEYF